MAVTGAAGCDATGEISIRLVLPADEALSPVDDRLAEITLVTTSDEDGRAVQSREVVDREAGVALGTLPAGSSLTIAVELRSPTQRLLGFGQTAGAVEIESGEVTEIELEVRRPFVYLSGQAERLEVYDPTLDPGQGYGQTIALGEPRATAPTADGTEVVVVSRAASGGSLRLMSTSDHAIASATVALEQVPSDVAVSPDGRWAVVGHGDVFDPAAGGGVSIVDLLALRGGDDDPARYLDLGAVGAVASWADDGAMRAAALVDRAPGCVEDLSSLALLELADRGGAEPADPVVRTVPLGAAIADLTVDSAGAITVADPCDGRLAAVGDDGELTTVVDLAGAGAVAAVGDRIWGAGVAAPSGSLGRRVVLVGRGGASGGDTLLALPPAQERISSIEFSGADQEVEVAMDADGLEAIELAALPGSDLVALTTWGYYHADESGDFLGSPVVPEMEITTFEYLLIDASARSVVQRVRTWCDGFLLSEAVLTEFTCSTAPDQDSIPFDESFAPSQVAVLYGGR